jgi:hypothetical protein
MRTKPSNILNACPYCNNDHDPSIRCRYMPESARFQLGERKPEPAKRTTPVTDTTGKLIAVRTDFIAKKE